MGSSGVLRHGKMNLLGWAAAFAGPNTSPADQAISTGRHGSNLESLLEEPRSLADDAARGSWVPHDRATLGVLYYRGIELLQAPGREDDARTLLELAASGYRATGMLDLLPVALGYLAEAERKTGRLERARQVAEEAQHLLDTGCPSLLNEAPVYLVLHDLLVDMGEFQVAKDTILKGLPRLLLRAQGLAGTPYARQFLTELSPNFCLLAAAEAYGVVPDEIGRLLEEGTSSDY